MLPFSVFSNINPLYPLTISMPLHIQLWNYFVTVRYIWQAVYYQHIDKYWTASIIDMVEKGTAVKSDHQLTWQWLAGNVLLAVANFYNFLKFSFDDIRSCEGEINTPVDLPCCLSFHYVTGFLVEKFKNSFNCIMLPNILKIQILAS